MRFAHRFMLSVALAVALISGVGYYATVSSEKSLREAIARTSAAQATAVMDEIDRVIHMRISECVAFSRCSSLRSMARASNKEFEKIQHREEFISELDREWRATVNDETSELIRELMANELAQDLRSRFGSIESGHSAPVFGEVFVTNRYGANIAQTNRTSDYRQNDEEWWRLSVRDGMFVGDVAFDKSAGIYSTDICVRIDGEDGQLLGVLKTVLNIQGVVDVLDARGRESGSGMPQRLVLFNGQRKIIHTANQLGIPLADAPHYFSDVAINPQNGVTTVERLDAESGERFLSTFAFSKGFGGFNGLGWILLHEYKADDVFLPVRRLRNAILFYVVGATLVVLILGGALAYSLSRRIRSLSAAANAFGRGEYDTAVDMAGRDELAQLGASFNRMVQDRELVEVQLKQHAAALELINTELGEANQAAQTANQSKSEFLANMSHELRTPMTAILGYAELLAEIVADREECREYLRTIQRNGEHLQQLLNDILDLSKVESGKLDTESIDCSPCQLVAEVASMMRPRAQGKNVLLNVRFNSKIPRTIKSDPTRLRQALINLAGNAIKFTEAGNVTIAVEFLADGLVPLIQFKFSDTGIGIGPDALDLIFEPFKQADTSTTRRFGGTGLGLAITQRIAGLLGGSLQATSELGRGSEFILQVAVGSLDGVSFIEGPIDEAGFHDQPFESPVRRTLNHRILLVEDGPDNQRLISLILKKAGATVQVAENGQVGADMALAADSEGKPFDVILMDMQMPVMDGYDSTRLLRQKGYAHPIIALTAHAMDGDCQKCLLAGCDAFVAKPIDRKHLFGMIVEHCPHDGLVAST